MDQPRYARSKTKLNNIWIHLGNIMDQLIPQVIYIIIHKVFLKITVNIVIVDISLEGSADGIALIKAITNWDPKILSIVKHSRHVCPFLVSSHAQ